MARKIKKMSVVKLDAIMDTVSDTFNVNDKTANAPSLKLMINLIFPIGSGFIDFTDTDYSNYLGLTWERELLGMFPVGYNPNDISFDGIGKTGGEKEHTLTVNEMPSHTHTQNAHTHTQNAHNHTYSASSRYGKRGLGSAQPYWCCGDSTYGSATGTLSSPTATNQNTTATNQNTGGGQAHNNLPPYQVVSYWKRVDPNAKTMISFILNSTSYQAEEGMTWAEWCNSSYNTDGYYVSGNYVYSSSGRNISSVTPTSVIINGTTYYWNKEK